MRNKKFKPVETFLAIHILVFGLALLLPSNTFDNNAYQSMVLIASEKTWGIMCIVVSVIQLYAMLKNHRKLKIFGLVSVTFFYSFIGTMFLIATIVEGVVNTGIAYFVIAGFSLWLTYTIGGQNE